MRTIALFMLLSSPALADEPAAWSMRGSVGCELAIGAHTGIAAFRGHVAIDHLIHHESRLGLGVTTAAGAFYNLAVPSYNSRHAYPFESIGPELVYTLDGLGEGDAKLFATLALVDTFFAYQFGERVDGWGGRATIGVNWVGMVSRLLQHGCGGSRSDDCAGRQIFALLTPHQFEISVEHDPGTTRVGVVMSYGY